MTRPDRAVPALFFAASLQACSPGPAAGEPVRVETRDGYVLTGTLWQVEEVVGGVLLMHPCDEDRRVMDRFGEALQIQGLAALSFDFRGLGESVGGFDLSKQGEAADWDQAAAGFPLDALAALEVLREEIPAGEPLAIIGSSCGARETVRLAAERAEVTALVVISARLEPADRETLLALARSIPVFAIAAAGDRRAAETARAVAGAGGDARVRVFEGTSAHAARLVAREPQLVGEITSWLAERLAATRAER